MVSSSPRDVLALQNLRPQARSAFLVVQMVKNLPAMQESQVWSLGWEELLENGMATHFSFLAWEIPRTEESGGLQSMGLHRVGRNQATKHACQSYWTIIFILKYLGYYIYILNFENP